MVTLRRFVVVGLCREVIIYAVNEDRAKDCFRRSYGERVVDAYESGVPLLPIIVSDIDETRARKQDNGSDIGTWTCGI